MLYPWPSYVPQPCRLPIAQVDEGSGLSFAVVKSSGATKSLETIELEQTEKSNQQVESTFDPMLVYGVVAVCSVFAVIGVGTCITIVIVNRKKRDKSKIHAVPENENERSTHHVDQNLIYARMDAPERVTLNESQERISPLKRRLEKSSR